MSDEVKKEEPTAAAAESAQSSAETAQSAAGETAAAKESAEAKEAETAEPKAEKAAEKPAEPDWKDLYARLLADFDNFKKRTARDREDTYRYAEADILKDILPTVDNLALALNKAEGDKKGEDPFVKGVKLVLDTLLNTLKDHGAVPFDSVGSALDTEKMEAIAHLPSETVAEGKVSNEAKRGWMLKDKVLRVAQVVVSSGKPQ